MKFLFKVRAICTNHRCCCFLQRTAPVCLQQVEEANIKIQLLTTSCESHLGFHGKAVVIEAPGRFGATKYDKRCKCKKQSPQFAWDWNWNVRRIIVAVRSWARWWLFHPCCQPACNETDIIRWMEAQKHRLCRQSQHWNLLFISTWKQLPFSSHKHTHIRTHILCILLNTHTERQAENLKRDCWMNINSPCEVSVFVRCLVCV